MSTVYSPYFLVLLQTSSTTQRKNNAEQDSQRIMPALSRLSRLVELPMIVNAKARTSVQKSVENNMYRKRFIIKNLSVCLLRGRLVTKQPCRKAV